ncbi:uncharacterized protein N7483_010449 [Penicillium malachiteum]|uniref:uncharacterized protein n=1 Tax=Penicillium malachiteum TaxID=1324776 RepID=UPI002546A772|nr:uncharacterized protein N7483_010449 [Penicillium malachiteum]KAJ5713268.1 hypothetical protein N7483_010449 [Penicillium malachiteum]
MAYVITLEDTLEPEELQITKWRFISVAFQPISHEIRLRNAKVEFGDLVLSDTWPDEDEEDEGTDIGRIPSDWETANQLIHESFEQSRAITEISPSARAVMEREGALCNIDTGDPSEMPVHDILYCNQRNLPAEWGTLIMNMHWRSFRQSMIWHVFLHLHSKGLVDENSLILPVNVLQLSTNAMEILCLLGCFQFIRTQSHEAFFGKIPGQGVEWLTDIGWLATMILRSRAEGKTLGTIVEAIKECGMLGKLDKESLNTIKRFYPYPSLQRLFDSRDGELSVSSAGEVVPVNTVFAFWLPHGLTNNREVFAKGLNDALARAKAIEEAFVQYQNLPAGALVLNFPTLQINDGDDTSIDSDQA